MHLRNDAKPPEAAHLELGEVIPRHILDHLSPGIDQAAVSSGHAASEHVVPDRAETVAERPGRRGRHN